MRKHRSSRPSGSARYSHCLHQLEPLEPRQLLSVDLSGSFATSPTQLFSGTRAVVSLNINNNGTTAFRGNLAVRFFIVENGSDFDPDTATGGLFVARRARIAAGGTLQQTFRIPVPRNADTGDFHLVAVIDPRNRIAETDETNNVAESDSFVVTHRPVDIVPDFTVFNSPPVTVVSGRHTLATLRVTLTNEGTETMDPNQSIGIRVVARPVGAINASRDVVINHSGARINVGGLDPGDSHAAFLPVVFPPSIRPGDFHIILTADPGNKVFEINEFNNVAILATPITVVAPPITTNAVIVTGSGQTVVTPVNVVPVTTTTSGTTTVVPIGASNTSASGSALGLTPTSGVLAITPTGVVTTPNTTTTSFVPVSTVNNTPIGFFTNQSFFVATTPVGAVTLPTTIITQPVTTVPISVAPTAGLSLLPQPVGTVNTVPQTVNLGLFPTSTTGVSLGTMNGITFI